MNEILEMSIIPVSVFITIPVLLFAHRDKIYLTPDEYDADWLRSRLSDLGDDLKHLSDRLKRQGL